jgi:hypothetical protein
LDAVERRSALWLVEHGAPQTVADTAWALGTLNHHRAPALFAAIEKRADWLVAKCSPWSIGNTARAFATVGHAAPTLFDAIDVRGIWLVMNGRPPDLAQITYASAMLGHTMPAFFRALERRGAFLVAYNNKDDVTPQSVARAAWACATLDRPAPNLFGAILPQLEWLATHGTALDLAHIVWAFARLGHTKPGLSAALEPTLLDAIENRADWLVAHASPEEISNTVWAFAKLRCKSPTLVKAIASRADWLVDHSSPRDVAHTAWAFAVLRHTSSQASSTAYFKAVTNGKPRDVSNIAWAYGRLGYRSKLYFAAVERRSDWLDAWDILNTAWAGATLGHPMSPALVAALERRADYLVENGTVPDLANTVETVAVTRRIKVPTLLASVSKQWNNHFVPQNVTKEDREALRSLIRSFRELGHPLS